MLRELAYLIRQDLVDLKEGICGLFKGEREEDIFLPLRAQMDVWNRYERFCQQKKEVICDPEELLP